MNVINSEMSKLYTEEVLIEKSQIENIKKEEELDDYNVLNNYKGIYFGEEAQEKYFEGGAHFCYKDLYLRLENILEDTNTHSKENILSDQFQNSIISWELINKTDNKQLGRNINIANISNIDKLKKNGIITLTNNKTISAGISFLNNKEEYPKKLGIELLNINLYSDKSKPIFKHPNSKNKYSNCTKLNTNSKINYHSPASNKSKKYSSETNETRFNHIKVSISKGNITNSSFLRTYNNISPIINNIQGSNNLLSSISNNNHETPIVVSPSNNFSKTTSKSRNISKARVIENTGIIVSQNNDFTCQNKYIDLENIKTNLKTSNDKPVLINSGNLSTTININLKSQNNKSRNNNRIYDEKGKSTKNPSENKFQKITNYNKKISSSTFKNDYTSILNKFNETSNIAKNKTKQLKLFESNEFSPIHKRKILDHSVTLHKYLFTNKIENTSNLDNVKISNKNNIPDFFNKSKQSNLMNNQSNMSLISSKILLILEKEMNIMFNKKNEKSKIKTLKLLLLNNKNKRDLSFSKEINTINYKNIKENSQEKILKGYINKNGLSQSQNNQSSTIIKKNILTNSLGINLSNKIINHQSNFTITNSNNYSSSINESKTNNFKYSNNSYYNTNNNSKITQLNNTSTNNSNNIINSNSKITGSNILPINSNTGKATFKYMMKIINKK